MTRSALTVDQVAALADLENMLRSLLKGEWTSLHLTFNEMSGYYEKVAQYDDENPERMDCWVSPDEREKGRAENSCWMLQWYPNTPVGFHSVCASSLPALLEYVMAEQNQ